MNKVIVGIILSSILSVQVTPYWDMPVRQDQAQTLPKSI